MTPATKVGGSEPHRTLRPVQGSHPAGTPCLAAGGKQAGHQGGFYSFPDPQPEALHNPQARIGGWGGNSLLTSGASGAEQLVSPWGQPLPVWGGEAPGPGVRVRTKDSTLVTAPPGAQGTRPSASLTSFSGLGWAPGQPAVGSNQHLPPCGPEGLCGARPRGLRQLDHGTALLPRVVHVGLSPAEQQLLGFLWGRQTGAGVHSPVGGSAARPPRPSGRRGPGLLCAVAQAPSAHAAPR